MSGTNPPAFPTQEYQDAFGRRGMTLRDWFAGQALAAMTLSEEAFCSRSRILIASAAYQLADEMLERRVR